MKKTHCVSCLLYIRDRNSNQNFESNQNFCPSSFDCTLLPVSWVRHKIRFKWIYSVTLLLYIIHMCVQQKSYDSSNGVQQNSVHFAV